MTTATHRRWVALGASLFFIGLLAYHGNLLGNTLASAVVPLEDDDADLFAEPRPPAPAPVVEAEHVELYREAQFDFAELTPVAAALVDDETLWLARCIFSETKRPHEQELVAWVVRNRVETGYRGKTTYRGVVLDPMQFSAFNPGSRTRAYYSRLTAASAVPGWQTALRIAHDVRHAQTPEVRPFSKRTRHFYSERSMVGRRHPEWASGLQPVTPRRPYPVEARRFRFFTGVS